MELSKIGLLLAKAEATYGVDPGPTAGTNNIAVARGQVTLDPMGNAMLRDILDQGYARVVGKNTNLAMGLKFRCELRGNRTDGTTADISAGAVGQKIEIDPLLQACDLAPTYTAESGVGVRDGVVSYQPVIPTTDLQSVTFYFYSQGKLYKITGAKGDLSISLASGKFGYIDFEFKGRFNSVVDSTLGGLSPTFLATKPPTWDAPVRWVAQAVTMTNASDLVTLNAHGLSNGDQVRFAASVTPAGITLGKWYYVFAATTNTFKIATNQGGPALDFTTDGTAVTIDSQGGIVWDDWIGNICSKLDLKLGNNLTQVDDANSPYGVYGFRNGGRNSSGGIDPESVKEATHPIWADFESMRSKLLKVKFGTQSGNEIGIEAKTAISKVTYEDRAGRRIQNAQLEIAQDVLGGTLGSELRLKFF
jgi:hypothetical protein